MTAPAHNFLNSSFTETNASKSIEKKPKIKIHSHKTRTNIIKKELYLPSTPLSKDQIKEKTIELSKMLLEEV